jgi:hypothetical protein
VRQGDQLRAATGEMCDEAGQEFALISDMLDGWWRRSIKDCATRGTVEGKTSREIDAA